MGKKILLADDSITIQKVIELTFSDEDFDVVTVGNGRLAIEKAQEVVPDVVLCDIIMPEKDGYEVCAFIKKTPGLTHIPVLLLTGAFEPFDQDRAARVGCDGFLAKPFEPQTLIAKVKDLLAQNRTGAGLPTAAVPAPVGAGAPDPASEPLEFEPLYAMPDEAPLSGDGGFQPLEPVTEFEPLETVAFEPVVSSPEPEPFVAEPAPLPPMAAAPPAPAVPPPDDDVAFIPEEPLDTALPSAVPMVAGPEPVFIPEDDVFATASQTDDLVAVEQPSAELEEEPQAATLPPGWARATQEVPLEERARASMVAAYGEAPLAVASESLFEEPSLTLEPDVARPVTESVFDPIATAGFEDEPLVEMAQEATGQQEALEEEPSAPPESIFEAMGLEQAPEPAAAEPQPQVQAVDESAPEEALAPEWVSDAPEPLEEVQELAPELDAEESVEDVKTEAVGAEALLDEDLSGPVDFGEPVASLDEAAIEPEPERQAAVLAPAAMAFESASDLLEAEPDEPIPSAELEADELEPPVAALPDSEEVSFDDVVPEASPVAAEAAARHPSSAAEVGVPVDMVAQIAQRVVGQISEKVIREIAWEVIPELAEALIKKEIERLKAELQQLQ